MKLIVLQRRGATIGQINEFHITLFHGTADVGDGGWLSDTRMLGDDVTEPLQVSRNAWRVPDVFQPGLTLIVSSRVAAALADVPNVQLNKVQFRKLVWMPFQAGDFSYFKTPQFRSDPIHNAPDNLIDNLPDVPGLHNKIGDYYEVLVRRAHEIADSYRPLKTVRFPLAPSDVPDDYEDAQLSERMLQDFQIVWASRVIFQRHTFALIEPFLDFEYFWKWELDL